MAEGKVVNPLVSKRLDEATTMVETLRIYCMSNSCRALTPTPAAKTKHN